MRLFPLILTALAGTLALSLSCSQDLGSRSKDDKDKEKKKSSKNEDDGDEDGDGKDKDTESDSASATDTATATEQTDTASDTSTDSDTATDEGTEVEDTRVKADSAPTKTVKGPGSCPKGAGVFAADDSSGVGVSLLAHACWPLPKSDVLADGDDEERTETCGDDEIVVGIKQDRILLCHKIDKAKYGLKAATACYYANSTFPGLSTDECSDGNPPPKAKTGLGLTFGSDGCTSEPFGALLTGDKGAKCSDKTFKKLVDANGDDVEMFK